ncbi:hypothetical protein PTHTG4_27110 [Parageobacillus thermoglucosidasius]|uniref:hypothetical protein n=1 Tax=Parageobacillus thermoglucosidasius TaxID=1426 RepID=UPI000F622D47|nr:hypothetical protein [Parageobacillus thermoglucosidasius]GCD83647.1 hypothetical protein PTHTG4_27110 [Parageobacillus thermoglucosidasius]
MKKVTCSIDKVAALVVIDDIGKLNKFISKSLYVKNKWESNRRGEYDTNIECIDGTRISINTRKKTISLNSKLPIENCRIEFNPNTVKSRNTMNELQEVLSFMKYPRFTRLDYAIDYYGYDLSSLQIIPPHPLTSEKHYSKSGKLETVVYGTGNGIVRFQLYDKKKERGLSSDNPEWWRLEAQRRRFNNEDDYFSNPFEKMQCILPFCFPDDIDPKDKTMLIGLHYHPELWSELKKDFRIRLRKIQIQSKQLSPHPSEVFKENINHMKLQLKNIFQPCKRNEKIIA